MSFKKRGRFFSNGELLLAAEGLSGNEPQKGDKRDAVSRVTSAVDSPPSPPPLIRDPPSVLFFFFFLF